MGSKPCVYSTLNYPYENTFPCNFTNIHSKYYCPIGYACIDSSEESLTPFSCHSEELHCNMNCTSVILDLPLMNGNETARIFEDSTSIWSVYSSAFSMVFFVCLAIVLMILTWIPQIRRTKKVFIYIFMIWICMIFLGVGIVIGGSIFISTTPYYLYNYSDCFSDDFSYDIRTVAILSDIHFICFLIQILIIVFLLIFTSIHGHFFWFVFLAQELK